MCYPVRAPPRPCHRRFYCKSAFGTTRPYNSHPLGLWHAHKGLRRVDQNSKAVVVTQAIQPTLVFLEGGSERLLTQFVLDRTGSAGLLCVFRTVARVLRNGAGYSETFTNVENSPETAKPPSLYQKVPCGRGGAQSHAHCILKKRANQHMLSRCIKINAELAKYTLLFSGTHLFGRARPP